MTLASPSRNSADRRLLVLLSRLHCNDGIAANLNRVILGLVRDGGWRASLVTGLLDVPEGTEWRLQSLREACERVEVDPVLAGSSVNPAALIRQARAVSRIGDRVGGADVIQLRGRGLGPACWAARRIGGPPVVQTLPLGVEPLTGVRGTARRAMGRMLGDRVIATSTSLAEQATSRLGVPPGRVRLVAHGVTLPPPPDEQERREARAAAGIDAGSFVVCVLARLDPVKRPETTIAAVARLVGEGRDVVLTFAGTGGEEDTARVRRLADQARIGERVRLLGYVEPRSALLPADAKVLASELEGFATAVVEAMACGVVPVRTPVEGASDQITDGFDGLLFPVGDDAALADRLRFLMDHPGERRRMGEAAARTAREKFSAEAMADKTAAVYRELTDGQPPDPRTLPATGKA